MARGYDRVLVPIEDSPGSAAAVPWVDALPSRLVYLFRVAPVARGARPPTTVETPALLDLERIATRLRRPDREVEPLVVAGDPAERIVDAAADADLIVMATRARGAGGRALFGAVVDAVARRVPIPSLIVRGPAPDGTDAAIHRVVVPLDGSPLAEAALPQAERLAAAAGAALHLVRVVPVRAGTGNLLPTIEGANDLAARATAATYLAEIAARRLSPPVSTEVRAGVVSGELLAALAPGDVVAITSRGHAGLRRWLAGSVTETLVRAGSAPVLLVPLTQ